MTEAGIFEDLQRDHDKHRTLLSQLSEASGAERHRDLFVELRKELKVHAAAKKESLYATILGNPELRDEAPDSVSEHKEIDDKLGELLDVDTASPFWDHAFPELTAMPLRRLVGFRQVAREACWV